MTREKIKQKYIDLLLLPETIRHNGIEKQIKPEKLAEEFGDGLQIIAIQPLATRPHYYVVCVDSNWSLQEKDKWAANSIREHLDEIYEAIAIDFGETCNCDSPEDCVEEYPPAEHSNNGAWFPMLNDEYGSTWWEIANLKKGGDLEEMFENLRVKQVSN